MLKSINRRNTWLFRISLVYVLSDHSVILRKCTLGWRVVRLHVKQVYFFFGTIPSNCTEWKYTYKLRGMASTLRMRTTISPGQWQPWSAVLLVITRIFTLHTVCNLERASSFFGSSLTGETRNLSRKNRMLSQAIWSATCNRF